MNGVPAMQPLGELELQVMEYVWDSGEGDAKAIHRRIGLPRGITLSTIQSTLKRLFSKGLLQRDKVSHAHVYRATLSRADFHRELLDQLVGELMVQGGASVVAAFVDLTERAGPEHLDQLEALLAERRRERGKGQ